MPRDSKLRFVRRHAAFIAVAALMLAYAWPMQGFGYNQTSHYILVKALADAHGGRGQGAGRGRRPRDPGHHPRRRSPLLEQGTGARRPDAPDVPGPQGREARGRSAIRRRCSGRSVSSAPCFRRPCSSCSCAGLLRRSSRGSAQSQRSRWGSARSCCRSRRCSSRTRSRRASCSPRSPSSFVERRGRPRPALLVAAGVLAGLAITTEYPTALVGFVLGVYALARSRPLLRGVAFGGGVLAGVVPLALYNWWAFGSPTHLSYQGTGGGGGQGLEHIPAPGFRPAVLLETLFGGSGLLALSPVLVCGAVGTALLYRRGFRAETLVIVAAAALYLLYNSGYGTNFGGFSPGQRYLIPLVPLLAFPLAAAFRAFPVTTGALALVSTVIAVATTATYALAGYKADWFDRVGNLQFTPTPLSLVGVTGWYTILPFFLAVATAGVFAVVATSPPRLTTGDMLAAPFAVLRLGGGRSDGADDTRPRGKGGSSVVVRRRDSRRRCGSRRLPPRSRPSTTPPSAGRAGA